jgi:heptosyltransferase-2
MEERLKSIDTILVRCPNWVGDIVMATPAFECLRNSFPKAKIIACIRKYALGVIDGGPWFDGVIECNDKTLSGLMQTISHIRNAYPNMAVLFPNSVRSWLETKFGGVELIYGYRRNLRKIFLTGGPKPVRTHDGIKPMPMVDYYLELCRSLGLSIPETIKPRLFISDQLQEMGERRLAAYGINAQDKVIGLNPGASFGSSKCWPPEYFARLAELLEAQLDCKIILFAGPGEEDIAGDIVGKSLATIINTAPDRIDLANLKPLVKRCDLLVTNDTGPRHYAVAFDVPVVVLMGPTNPLYTSANLDKTIVIRKDMECSPCHKKICPTDHRCMKDISPETVFENVKKMLTENFKNR